MKMASLKEMIFLQAGGVLFHCIVESTGKPNTTYADAQGLYENVLFSLWENWVGHQTFVKLKRSKFRL